MMGAEGPDRPEVDALIRSYLTLKEGVWFCDACVAKYIRLIIPDADDAELRHRVALVGEAVSGFERATDICSRCSRRSAVTRYIGA